MQRECRIPVILFRYMNKLGKIRADVAYFAKKSGYLIAIMCQAIVKSAIELQSMLVTTEISPFSTHIFSAIRTPSCLVVSPIIIIPGPVLSTRNIDCIRSLLSAVFEAVVRLPLPKWPQWYCVQLPVLPVPGVVAKVGNSTATYGVEVLVCAHSGSSSTSKLWLISFSSYDKRGRMKKDCCSYKLSRSASDALISSSGNKYSVHLSSLKKCCGSTWRRNLKLCRSPPTELVVF